VPSRNASFPIGPFRSAQNRSLAESQYVHATSIARFGSHDSETQGEHQMF
jgi:hypothetical protein